MSNILFTDMSISHRGRSDDVGRLRGSVTFTGPINAHDLTLIYCAAYDFFLVCEKGLGCGKGILLTPNDAMTSGLPVLLGDDDVSPEALKVAEEQFGFKAFVDKHCTLRNQITRLS